MMKTNNDEMIVKLVNLESQNSFLDSLSQGGATIVASALTVFATLIAVYCTNRNQRRIETIKLKRQKLEELHEEVYKSGRSLLNRGTTINHLSEEKVRSLFSDFYNTKVKIEVLVNLHFKKELEDSSRKYIESIDFLFKCLKLKFKNEIIDDLMDDIELAKQELSYASDELDTYMEENLEYINARERDAYSFRVKQADKNLDKYSTKLSLEYAKFEETEKRLKEQGNPTIDDLVKKIEESKEAFLEEILKEVKKIKK